MCKLDVTYGDRCKHRYGDWIEIWTDMASNADKLTVCGVLGELDSQSTMLEHWKERQFVGLIHDGRLEDDPLGSDSEKGRSIVGWDHQLLGEVWRDGIVLSRINRVHLVRVVLVSALQANRPAVEVLCDIAQV